MEYMHDQFPYPPQPPRQQVLYHPQPYPPYLQHPQQQLDDFYMTYGHHPEYTEFMPHGPFNEEYEDVGDVPTRPRLTKEQVGILEAQFQANHKPSSMVKRQLAMQTNLSLPRVANWFQNRRAKAKQQKKQEEFENSQFNEDSQQDRPCGDGSAVVKDEDDQLSDDEDFLNKRPANSDAEDSSNPASNDAAKEAAWASLQRALNAAKASPSAHQVPPQPHVVNHMPSEMQPEQAFSPPRVGMRQSASMQVPHSQSFSRKQSWADAWASHQVFQDQSFDFGFADQTDSASYRQSVLTESHPHNLIQESCVVAPDTWQDGLPTPRGIGHDQFEDGHGFQSPDLPLPMYPEARRGSAADSLTNNFDAFALATESPHALTTPVSALPGPQPETHLDLAARRKRPRPAALTSASLRSRSYGAMTSMSPTFRPGMTPTHAVRHVKSTGHNLNARYSGVRKPSSAQRSPITFTTFAEADAFNALIAQQAATVHASQASGSLQSPGLMVNAQPPADHMPYPMAQKMDLARSYQLPNTQHLTLMTASPPTTPFAAEFDPSHAAFGMPPVSAPPQYASFPDYTPPYSAGPLTNSSWSDAPLTSPDLPNFPPVTYIPSLGHPQKSESMSGPFSEFVLASESKPDMESMSEQKKTDFFIQEFPNQKEEHAHVARQLAQHKPKNYVFANTAPSDYDQS